jgi:hypothetical protein
MERDQDTVASVIRVPARVRFFATMLFGLLLPAMALAQIQNSGFDTEAGGWSFPVLPASNAMLIAPVGGNPGGCASITSWCPRSPARAGCIEQVFACGDSTAEDSCRVGFDFYVSESACLETIADYEASLEIDGVMVWSRSGELNGVHWTRVGVVAKSGLRRIRICGRVYNGSRMCFDNFDSGSMNQVPVAAVTWGSIKARY